MRIRAPYRLEPRPGGYTVVIPRPCNDCDASGIVARTRRHYPTTYAHCETCKGSGSTEARFEIVPFWPRFWTVRGLTFHRRFDSPALAAEAIVASFARPWNNEPTPRTEAEIIDAACSGDSPL